MTSTETGQITGTKDKHYNILWYTQACLDNALRLESYIQDAERERDGEIGRVLPQGPGRQPQGRLAG